MMCSKWGKNGLHHVVKKNLKMKHKIRNGPLAKTCLTFFGFGLSFNKNIRFLGLLFSLTLFNKPMTSRNNAEC